jgi:hypothetical protein
MVGDKTGACLGVPGALGQTMDHGQRNEGTLGRGGGALFGLFGGRVWRSTRCSHFSVPHAVGWLTATEGESDD